MPHARGSFARGDDMTDSAEETGDRNGGWRMPDPAKLWDSLGGSIDAFVTVIDPECRVRAINQVSDGFDAAAVIGRSAFDFIHPDDVDRVRAEYAKMFATATGVAIDMRVVDDRGGTVPYSVRAAPVMEAGRVVAAVLTSHDQRAMVASEASLQSERTVLRGLLDTLERERRLISCEIHDGLAQYVTSAAMLIDACTHALDSGDRGEGTLRRDLAEARRGVGAAIDEARRLINGLRPPMLDELGILAAVESLVIEGAGSGREIEYRHPGTLPPIAADLATAIFRIVQESLSNVRKHARRAKVTVTLAPVGAERKALSVEIVDDGVGFDPAAVAAGAFGLEGIRRRARHFGTEASIESTPGKGTRIAVVFPLGGPPG